MFRAGDYVQIAVLRSVNSIQAPRKDDGDCQNRNDPFLTRFGLAQPPRTVGDEADQADQDGLVVNYHPSIFALK